MGAVKGLLLVKTILKRIQLSKQLFMLEIEQGNEVFIPQDLSQDQFPISFWYYDSILKII